MKRKEIRHIERDLTLKKIKHQKKYGILILCVSMLACTLIQLGLQTTEGIMDSIRIRNREIYGEWEAILPLARPQAEEIIEANPFVEKKGRISIYGVLDPDFLNNEQSNIGTVDDSAWELGKLQVMEGRIPQTENEIAIEYSMAASLGYEDCLGKNITIKVTPSTTYGTEMPEKVLVYQLCGFIKDYQVNWEVSTRYRLPAAVVTSEGAERIGSPLETHILLKAKEGYLSVYEDLKKNDELFSGLYDNVYMDSFSSENLPYKKFLEDIQLLVAGISIGILFITVSRSIDSRQNYWKFLYELGLRKRQMYQMLIWEAAIYGLSATICGILTGVLGYRMFIPLIGAVMDYQFSKNIDIKSMVIGAMVSICIIFTSYFFSCMRLNKLLKGGKQKKYHYCKRKGKIRLSKKFTPMTVLLHEWYYAPFRKGIQVLLLSSILILVGTGIIEAYTKESDLKMFHKMTGNGYFLSTEEVENSRGIRADSVCALSEIIGVESVEAYRTTGFKNFTVDLSPYSKSTYVNKVVITDKTFNPASSLEQVSFAVLGINEWDNMKRFAKNLSEGVVTEQDVIDGDFCILLLPPLQKMEEGVYLGNDAAEDYNPSYITDDSIRVGDTLRISYWNTDETMIAKDIPITAILRTSKRKDIRAPYPGGAGIHAIVGEKFWNDFNLAGEGYQLVRINLADDADVFGTEEHILRNLKKVETHNLNNYHEEYVRKQQDMYSFIGLYCIFFVFYVILVFIILYQMLEMDSHERSKKIEIFTALGMHKDFIQTMKKTEVLFMTVISTGVGITALVLYFVRLKDYLL